MQKAGHCLCTEKMSMYILFFQVGFFPLGREKIAAKSNLRCMTKLSYLPIGKMDISVFLY